MSATLPYLSQYAPISSNESAIYPLGVNIIAETLATKLAPGVRERQVNPRYLTAMAVSAVVCGYDEDAIAKDNISEPWQVFEWYVVEGLVRKMSKDQLKQFRLPGIDKVEKAIKDRVPLNAKRYLVMPNVFGFHGVYRVLAKELDIVRDGQIWEKGVELVLAWEKDQKLDGFYYKQQGPGLDLRVLWEKAVKDGLEAASTSRPDSWRGWEAFAAYLNPKIPGKNELEVIKACLFAGQSDLRRQIIMHLIKDENQKIWWDTKSERKVHENILKNASGETAQLLETILEYEKFSRYIQDAFDDILAYLSTKKTKSTHVEIFKHVKEKNVVSNLNTSFKKNMALLEPYQENIRFDEWFGKFSEKVDGPEFVKILIDHHLKIQKKKPPNGRAPWIEVYDDGTYMVRQSHMRDEGGSHDGEYVNYYRTIPLQSFAEDLNMVKKHG